MKKSRSIHLLFILLAVSIIACFWAGFMFGKETQRQEDLIAITEAQLEAQTTGNISQNNQDTSINNDSAPNLLDKEETESNDVDDTMETNSEISQPQFYLMQSGEYVSVYVSATDELYFETDILVSDLPIELQEEMQYGLDFYDLEGVYTFLENYSS